jgi:hypothetical protein
MCSLHHAHNANKHARTQRERKSQSATSANEQRLLRENEREGGKAKAKAALERNQSEPRVLCQTGLKRDAHAAYMYKQRTGNSAIQN